MVINGTPEYVRKCCEASLVRLGVSYIDLYYQHRVDISMPIEDTVSIYFPSLFFPFVFWLHWRLEHTPLLTHPSPNQLIYSLGPIYFPSHLAVAPYENVFYMITSWPHNYEGRHMIRYCTSQL